MFLREFRPIQDCVRKHPWSILPLTVPCMGECPEITRKCISKGSRHTEPSVVPVTAIIYLYKQYRAILYSKNIEGSWHHQSEIIVEVALTDQG